MAFCSRCGTPLEADAAFCGSCGAKCNRAPAQNPNPQPTQPAQPAPSASPNPGVSAVRSLPKWLIPAIAIAAAIGVALFLFFGTNLFKSDEDLIRERIEDLEDAYNDGDLDAFMDCMDSTSRAAMELMLEGASAQSGMDIAQMFSIMGNMDDFCTITINSIEINGDTATVSVTMAISLYGMNQSQTEDMPMVKEDGDWYIGGTAGVIDSDYMNFLP